MNLRLLRSLYAEEGYIPHTTSSAPPLLRSVYQSRSGAWDVVEEREPADANGLNLSAPLVALIGGITTHHDLSRCEDCTGNPLLNEQTTHYSNRHPMRAAMTQLERRCRREHRPPTWNDHPTPICADLLHLTLVERMAPVDAYQRVGVSEHRGSALLGIFLRDLLQALRREENRLLGIADDSHRLKECPHPATCSVCSESFSPSQEAKAT